MSTTSINKARSLVNAKDFGVLATHSKKFEGFPFGSVVPYCLDGEGIPVILISTIAQHTKNISHDNRCSLTIIRGKEDVQAAGRICIIGHMALVSKDEVEVAERYYRHFPNSRSYSTTHDFSFYRLKPISYRYIGGFGAIHWFEPSEMLTDNPFHGKGEDRIVDHMNEDHQKNLIGYCEYYKKMTIAADDTIRMVGIDAWGFDVFVNDKKVRFDFEEAISTADEARKSLVALSKGIQ